jgi:hypothetical protein
MALAIECDRLIREYVIKNQSELAHYAQVTTARMTHIMWLTNLAPEIHHLYSVMKIALADAVVFLGSLHSVTR